MRTHQVGTHFFRELSVTEFANVATLTPIDENRDNFTRVLARSADDWTQGVAADGVTRMLTQGWADGGNKLTALASTLGDPPRAKCRRRRQVWGADGDDLHVDRALRGEWGNAWRSSRRETAAGTSHISLVAPWGGAGRRDGDELFWAPAVGLVLADWLENAGYSVALSFVSAARHDYPVQGVTVTWITAKTHEEPLRVDALAALAHPATFRIHGLAAIHSAAFPVGDSAGSEDATAFGRAECIEDRSHTLIPSVWSHDEAAAALAELRAKFTDS